MDIRATASVTIPNLDAHSLRVLGDELEGATLDTNKQRMALPAPVIEALDDMLAERDVLATQLGPVAPSEAEISDIDPIMDELLRGWEEICAGWARLSALPEKSPLGATLLQNGQLGPKLLAQGRIGAELHDLLFGKGMKFITRSPRIQWGVTQAMLQAIDTQKLDDKLGRLALTEVLALARELHAHYGAAAGITQAKVDDTPELRQPMANLREAMDIYVMRVAALRDRKKPETDALIARLLAPIDNARRSQRRRRRGPGDDPHDGPGRAA